MSFVVTHTRREAETHKKKELTGEVNWQISYLHCVCDARSDDSMKAVSVEGWNSFHTWKRVLQSLFKSNEEEQNCNCRRNKFKTMSTLLWWELAKSLGDVHKQSHDTMHSYTRFGVVVKENSLKRERNTKCSGIVLGSARPSAAKAQLSLSLPPSPLLSLHPTKILDAPTHCAIPPPPLVYSLLLPSRLCSSALPRLKHWTAITRSVCNKRKS